MKKYLAILTVIVIVVVIVLVRKNTDTLEYDANSNLEIENTLEEVCEICLNEFKRYDIENGAKIVVGVDNEIVGKQLVSLWNEMNQEDTGLLSYIVFNSFDLTILPDVYLLDEAEYQSSEFYLLDSSLQKNSNFLSYSYNGVVFSYNKTMLEEFGIEMLDSNNDSLPDSIDTWEEIFNLELVGESYKGNVINEIYPISINEVWTAYSSLTAGGYEFYKDGFESNEFLKGLEFIEEFSKKGINNDLYGMKLNGNRMGYRLDEYLAEEAYPFSLVGSWSNVNSFELMNGSNLKFAQMPTYNGNNLSPFTKIKGFVISKDTMYPSAAHEVLRWLTEQEALNVMTSFSNIVPTPNLEFSPEDDNLAEIIDAFNFNHIETTEMIPDTDVRALEIYYNANIGEYLVELWDGSKTALEVQQEIVVLSEAWVTSQK